MYKRSVKKLQKTSQTLTIFIGKFLDNGDGNVVKTQKGYHKAMYAAENVDKIAKSFLRTR